MRPVGAYWGHFAAKKPAISTNGLIQNDSGFLRRQIAHSVRSSLSTSSASALLPVETPAVWPHTLHRWEDCHDVQSSVVVASRFLREPAWSRIGRCDHGLGRESRRLHTAENGTAGRLSGHGNRAYRDVRCGEFDRAALSRLLRPTSG